MDSAPELLFLSHRLPFPPHNGAALRTYNVMRLLARDYRMTALCFDRRDPGLAGWSTADRLAAVSDLGTFELFPIPQETSRCRLIWDHLRSVVTGRPYTWYVHDSQPFLQRLRALLHERRFAVVHVDAIDLVRALPELGDLPVVLTHHNAEGDLLIRRAGRETSAFRRFYLGLQGRLLMRAERHWIPRVALNAVCSPDDEALLRELAPAARFQVVPNGVDTEYFRPAAQEPEGGLVFVGGTSWFPNRDALEYAATEIVPALAEGGVQEGITWVGRATEEERRRFGSGPSLRLTGYVEDVRPLVADARCFVVPLRVGGGTRLKILDAWAMGKAVVSTRIGCEGLATEPGENILVADTPAEFAAAVRRVLTDPALRRRLEQGARRTAEQHYSWESIGRSMLPAYQDLAARAKPATRGR